MGSWLLYPSFRQVIYHFITHNPIVILDPIEVYVLLKVFQPLNRYVESSWNVMAHGDARDGKW